MKFLLSNFIVFVLCLLNVNARPEGAPFEACDDMIPDHHVNSSQTPCPFATVPERLAIDSNGSVNLTLSMKTGETGRLTFQGFLLMAFDNSSTKSTPIGTFSIVTGGKIVNCSEGLMNAATHKASEAKSTVHVSWAPPKDFQGPVVFKTTFAENQTVFWTAQPSAVVRVTRSSAETTTVAPSGSTPAGSSVTNLTSATKTSIPTPTPTDVPRASSTTGLLAFYSLVVLALTLAFIA